MTTTIAKPSCYHLEVTFATPSGDRRCMVAAFVGFAAELFGRVAMAESWELQTTEQRVLRLLMHGLSVREIAQAMSVPERAAKARITAALRRLARGSRREFLEWIAASEPSDPSLGDLARAWDAPAEWDPKTAETLRREAAQLSDADSIVMLLQLLGLPTSDAGRSILQRLSSALELTLDDLGTMLGVSSKRIDEWIHGQSVIPPAQLAMLQNAAVALDVLEQTFEAERLPRVIRRAAALFEGERALDWILRGRIRDVAERYDRVLMYQA